MKSGPRSLQLEKALAQKRRPRRQASKQASNQSINQSINKNVANMLCWQERKKELAYCPWECQVILALEGDLVLTIKMRDVLYLGFSTSTPNIYSTDILTHVDIVVNRQIHRLKHYKGDQLHEVCPLHRMKYCAVVKEKETKLHVLIQKGFNMHYQVF